VPGNQGAAAAWAVECTLCVAGLYDHDGDATTGCEPCGSGRYAPPGTSGAECLPCAAGSYSAGTNVAAQSFAGACSRGPWSHADAA
jgi:hypothetical protein